MEDENSSPLLRIAIVNRVFAYTSNHYSTAVELSHVTPVWRDSIQNFACGDFWRNIVQASVLGSPSKVQIVGALPGGMKKAGEAARKDNVSVSGNISAGTNSFRGAGSGGGGWFSTSFGSRNNNNTNPFSASPATTTSTSTTTPAPMTNNNNTNSAGASSSPSSPSSENSKYKILTLTRYGEILPKYVYNIKKPESWAQPSVKEGPFPNPKNTLCWLLHCFHRFGELPVRKSFMYGLLTASENFALYMASEHQNAEFFKALLEECWDDDDEADVIAHKKKMLQQKMSIYNNRRMKNPFSTVVANTNNKNEDAAIEEKTNHGDEKIYKPMNLLKSAVREQETQRMAFSFEKPYILQTIIKKSQTTPENTEQSEALRVFILERLKSEWEEIQQQQQQKRREQSADDDSVAASTSLPSSNPLDSVLVHLASSAVSLLSFSSSSFNVCDRIRDLLDAGADANGTQSGHSALERVLVDIRGQFKSALTNAHNFVIADPSSSTTVMEHPLIASTRRLKVSFKIATLLIQRSASLSYKPIHATGYNKIPVVFPDTSAFPNANRNGDQIRQDDEEMKIYIHPHHRELYHFKILTEESNTYTSRKSVCKNISSTLLHIFLRFYWAEVFEEKKRRSTRKVVLNNNNNSPSNASVNNQLNDEHSYSSSSPDSRRRQREQQELFDKQVKQLEVQDQKVDEVLELVKEFILDDLIPAAQKQGGRTLMEEAKDDLGFSVNDLLFDLI